jgi:hypothetical protein
MAHPPHPGASPPDPLPASLPAGAAAPASSADRWAGIALIGLLCSLISCGASLYPVGYYLISVVLISTGTAPAKLPNAGSAIVALIASVPIALLGLLLSGAGRRSTSRRRWARAGVVLALVALLPFIATSIILVVAVLQGGFRT